MFKPKCNIYTEAGDHEIDELALDYNEDGSFKIVKTGLKINLHAQIQAFADSCDLHNIIENILLTSTDLSVFAQPDAEKEEDKIIDFSNIDSDDLQALISKTREIDSKLSIIEEYQRKMEANKASTSNNQTTEVTNNEK